VATVKFEGSCFAGVMKMRVPLPSLSSLEDKLKMASKGRNM